MTFVHAFLFHRKYQPDAPALCFPDARLEPVSYAALDDITRTVCGRLRSAGLRKGDIVALNLSNELLHAVLLVSCARLAIITLSGRPSDVSAHTPIRALISDQPLAAALAGGTATLSLTVDSGWLHPADVSDNAEHLCEGNPDDLCRIMLTSGTTGRPKGVALSYRMIDERINSFLYAFGSDFPDHGCLMGLMRLASSLGFAFMFYQLARGGFYCGDSADFHKMTNAIETFGIDALATTPFTLAELLKFCDAQSCRFPRVRLGMTAGSLLAPELARQVRTRICEKLVIFYGTTETGVVSSCWWEAGLGEVGAIVPGRAVELVDRSTPPGGSGPIRIRASSGFLPFYNLPDLESRKRQEWFEPGDVGLITTEGCLVIHGREDNIINVGGTKTTHEMLEQAVRSAPGVQDCAVLCERDNIGIDRIVAFLVLAPRWNEEAFKVHCEANIIRDFLPSKFVLLRQIPRNHNNKVDRAALLKELRYTNPPKA